MENDTGFSKATTTSPSLVQNMYFHKPLSEKISKTSVGNVKFWDQIGQNECAEGVLIVKCPFPGSKVRNGGPDRFQSTLQKSGVKKLFENFRCKKVHNPYRPPGGVGGGPGPY